MAFSEHRFSFAGRKVRDYDGGPISDLDQFGLRVRVDYDDSQSWTEKFQRMLSQDKAPQIASLLVGMWDSEMFDRGPDAVVEALVTARDHLPQLQAIFLGTSPTKSARFPGFARPISRPSLAPIRASSILSCAARKT
jgi:hypothetical protein